VSVRSRHLRTPSRIAAAGAVAVGALVLAGCGSVGYEDATGNASTGKTLFTQKCGSCHVLEDAGTAGTIGPNLDAAFYQFRAEIDDQGDAEDTIRQVVRGQISYPTVKPSTGAPGMPADIVKGQEAEDVSTYVASVAGTGDTADTTGGGAAPAPPAGGDSGGGGGGDAAAAGKAVFTAQCAACHTLADAGASGAVGPNLDTLKAPKALVQKQVTNGGGGMPAFKGVISDEEIEQVSSYVAESAGK
jgi:mono/diheme cytochrome c family protein